MRWFWVDRFMEFVSGDRATAKKNVSLAEPYLHGYLPSCPVMPNSLILEGMAQTGGLLLSEMLKYEQPVVLAKVSKITYHFAASPGDTLTYKAKLDSVVDEGARVSATSEIEGKLQAETEFYLAILPRNHEAERLFPAADFARLLRLMRIYDVGVDADGTPLTFPADLRAAEEADALS